MKILSVDGKLYGVMDLISKFITLSFIFIISAVPIFTIGASLTALNYTSAKIIEGKDEGIIKSFTYSFLADFKTASAVWFIFIGLFGFLTLALKLNMDYGLAFLQYPLMVLIALLALCFIHAFSFLARFDNTAVQVVVNASYISFNNMALSIVLFVINVALLLIPILTFKVFILWIVFVFPMISYINMKSLLKLYKNYEENSDVESI